MTETADRKFDWIAGLAAIAGTAVMIPSFAALGIALVAVVAALL